MGVVAGDGGKPGISEGWTTIADTESLPDGPRTTSGSGLSWCL
jgi:hypothetical protein